MEIINVPVRLTADPDELKKTPNGKLVVSFNVAHNWRTRTDGGFTDVDTTFFRCTLWEEQGASEFAAQGLRKGDRLRVSGRWSKNPWVDKDGKARIGDNLTVSVVSISQSTETEISGKQPSDDADAPAQPRGKSRRKAA
jgi:single stranded DNA-binding protein